MAERYSPIFDPLLRENQTVRLFGAGLPVDGFNCKCVAVGAMPEYYKDFGALTAGVWDEDQADTNLEMNKLELAQFRIRVIDDMRLRLKNSPPVQQWRSKSTVFYLPKFPSNDEASTFLQQFLWVQSEFFIWEDHTPSFAFYSEITTAAARVLFSGWRFKVEALPGNEKGKFDIWISDWPSRTPGS